MKSGTGLPSPHPQGELERMGLLKLSIAANDTKILRISSELPIILTINFQNGETEAILFPSNIIKFFRINNGPLPIESVSCEDGEISAPSRKERIVATMRHHLMLIARRERLRRMTRKFPLKHGGSVELFFLDRRQVRQGKLLQQLGLAFKQDQSPGWRHIAAPISAASIRELNAARPSPGPMTAPRPSFAISIHLYFADMWGEFEELISSLDEAPSIFVTMQATFDSRTAVERIRSFKHDADILHVENRGRDVLPFITQLNNGLFDDFDLICKLHTKASTGLKGGELLGEVWRRRMLLDLLGGQSQLESALRIFGSDDNIGMAGSGGLRVPNAHMGDPATPHCLELREQLAQRAFGHEPPPVDYYAGTMFWVRRGMLDPIRRMNLTADDFESEQQLGIEGMPHAFERFFADCVRMSGGRIVDMPEY